MFVMRGGCVRTRGDEVARENITQKEKKKKRLSTLSAARLPLIYPFFPSPALPPLTPLSALLSLPFYSACRRLQCAEPIEERKRERERERGRKRDDGESEGGEVEERNERVVTGSVCV